jgi:8-oxo-dGTP pyrophosphatase MutT (NUDIX family)
VTGEGLLGVQWRVLGTRSVYHSQWVDVFVDDIAVTDDRTIEHHVIKFPKPSVGAVVIDDNDRTLLLWRHRHITDTWGWEIPAGWCDPGESPIDAARREIEEETGYRANQINRMIEYKPMAGISTMHYTTFLATDVTHLGEPTDKSESTRVEWVPLTEIPRLARMGDITDGPSLTALSYYLGVYRDTAS